MGRGDKKLKEKDFKVLLARADHTKLLLKEKKQQQQ
jgi:hypothetical protein